MLIAGLPPDSALHRAARGHGWGDVEYMLAEIIDAAHALAAITAAANSKNGKYKPPKPFPRPDAKGDEGSDRDAEARARHDALRERLMPARG